MSDESRSLSERLGGVIVSARSELQFTRSVFRGEVCYIVRDPITFQSHKLPPAEYQILIRLSEHKPLGGVFRDLIADGVVTPALENDFYEFVLHLHRLGLLNLPVPDDEALYRRFEQKRFAAKKQRVLGFLFMQVPLFSPDAFLNRTIRFARPFFSRGAFAAWCALMLAVLYIVTQRWSELAAPLLSMLDYGNLPWMAVLLIGLKVIHEFGHAYACKHFGGKVPEMGAIFIVGTPCAYVDASAAWGFPRKRDRIIVSLGGMYAESVCAGLALLVWALTGPSFINTLAYQAFVLASIVTVGFNINPLMRFDGYYLLSDLAEVPNLRARSQSVALALFDRYILGLPVRVGAKGWGNMLFLGGFGIASGLYRITLVTAICGVIAMKIYFLGIAVAVFYVGSSLVKFIGGSIHHLCFATETAPVRARAVGTGVVLFVVLPALATAVPVALPVGATGIVAAEQEVEVRAESAGFLASTQVKLGERVERGHLLAQLEHPDTRERVLEAEARLDSVESELDVLRVANRLEAQPLERRATYFADALAWAERRERGLRVEAPSAGTVLQLPHRHRAGVYLPEGEPIALVGSGPWVARFFLHERAFTDCALSVGDRVECRAASDSSTVIPGWVQKIAPRGTRTIDEEALTHLGGGSIVVDPNDHRAEESYFEVTVALDPEGALPLQRGLTVAGRFSSAKRPIVHHLYRRVLQFIDRMRLQ